MVFYGLLPKLVVILRERSFGVEKDNIKEIILMRKEIPIWEKANLTLEEAAAYSGIGTGKLREITNDKNCNFVLWVGNKRLIKKRLFDQYMEQVDCL